MTDAITILHLSDLQFGKNHRYPDGEESFNSLYAKLVEDLDDLAEKRSLRPTAIGTSVECTLSAQVPGNR